MRLDLHIHSSYSGDGTVPPEQVILQCARAGLGGCAIVDHNVLEGSLKACSIGREHGIVVVRGLEVSTVEGHVLAYGIGMPVPRGLSIAETVDRIRAEGGVAIAAHPDRFASGIGLEAASKRSFDAIEVLNGGSSRRGNRRALKVAQAANAPQTGGSDAHELREIGRAWTEMDGISSEDDVVARVKKGLCRPGGRSRSAAEGLEYTLETTIAWLKRGMKPI